MAEEITVSHLRPGLTWIAGLFLFDEADRQPVSVRLGGPRLENSFQADVEANSRALFGQGTVEVTRRLSATAGLRYTRESKTTVSEGQLSTLDPPVTIVPGTAYWYTDAISHTAWTPKVGLDMRLGHAAVAYASATRGFKSGGFT